VLSKERSEAARAFRQLADSYRGLDSNHAGKKRRRRLLVGRRG